MLNFSAPAQDELELEAMAETELGRLKRQYRIMENDRLAYAEDARNQMRNQRNIIAKYEHEKAELVLAIKAAKSPGNAKADESASERLAGLLRQRGDFVERIKLERDQIREIDEQILKLSKEVHALRAKVRTDHQIKEASEKHERTVAILENRLEVATQRFNGLVTENAELRLEIDGLLKERAQFNAMWSRLNGQLNSGKGVINDLIEQATIAFNQRDEELSKINALKERGMRDLKSHTSEMCELQRTIDNEMKLQEFLGVKGQYREMADLNVKREAEKEQRIKEMRDKIDTYNHILKLVMKFTGEEEIDKLIAQFLKQEEENFALFNYVNELNDELEALQARVNELRAAIDEARALNVHRGQQQIDTLDSIGRELKQQTERADQAEDKLKQCNRLIERLLVGIDELFQSIGCDNSPILELLGDNASVNMNNVMLYLGIIEKRVVEMLAKMYYLDRSQHREPLLSEDRKPKLRVPDLQEIAPTQPCPLCIEAEEMENVSESLEKPLTLDEVREKLLVRLQSEHSHLLHNVSKCHLPAARKIIQKRYM
ncbi:hypothetical protein TKK_0016909 [Trichogramma kaykai]|uniref:ODAD1 central coiled coil region domain-containing protein n=1 Tax=Trichogramma kaykai TaxID=54128 RepID=A0ABD2W4E5_9HYME